MLIVFKWVLCALAPPLPSILLGSAEREEAQIPSEAGRT